MTHNHRIEPASDLNAMFIKYSQEDTFKKDVFRLKKLLKSQYSVDLLCRGIIRLS
jgi:hypothetical protein